MNQEQALKMIVGDLYLQITLLRAQLAAATASNEKPAVEPKPAD